MATKEVTVRQVFEALKENGFTHLRKQWFAEDVESGGIIGACVLGQAALNLGVYGSVQINKTSTSYYKDSLETNLQAQLNKFSVPKNSVWNESAYRLGVGDAIIHWNDKHASNSVSYVLPTYEDVVNMAYDLLSPYFDEKITLGTRKWKFNKKVEV